MPKEENPEKRKIKLNIWMIATAVLALLLIATFFSRGGITGNAISKQEAGEKTLSLINGYFIQEGSAALSGVEDESSLYKVNLVYNGQMTSVYITKDGKYLVMPNGLVEIATLEATASSSSTTQQEEETIPKSDKPIVELFVMSFCPYGVRAENNIMPVIESLGDSIDFEIKFIASVNGNSINDVSSLHGLNEAKEDARQAAIMEYYPDKFYDYLKEINANCYDVSRDAEKLDECWKNAAEKLDIDVEKIESVAYGEEGINLLKQDEEDTKKYGVSGSPTLIINGVKSSSIYSGTEATHNAICSSFNTAPTGCEEEVTGSETPAPSGSCS